MVWLLLLIPLLTALFLKWQFKRRVTILEVALPTVVCGIALLIGNGILYSVLVTDIEFWNGRVEEVRYYEDWNEEVSYTVYEYDEDGNVTGSHIETEIVDHGEYWIAYNNIGESYYLTEAKYRELVSRWKNETFEELNRNYHNNDGDMYYSRWHGDWGTMEPTISSHPYENKIQASSSIFNYPEVDPVKLMLIDYPSIRGYQCPTVLGDHYYEEADLELRRVNGALGSTKQVCTWLLVFKNRPRQTALDQEAYWLGGNKNEVVIMVGIDDNELVQWAHVSSWTEREDMKIAIRNYIQEQEKFQPLNTVQFAYKEIEQNFERKQFADFKYLAVNVPSGYLIFVTILTIVITAGIAFWITNNEFEDEEDEPEWKRRYPRRNMRLR